MIPISIDMNESYTPNGANVRSALGLEKTKDPFMSFSSEMKDSLFDEKKDISEDDHSLSKKKIQLTKDKTEKESTDNLEEENENVRVEHAFNHKVFDIIPGPTFDEDISPDCESFSTIIMDELTQEQSVEPLTKDQKIGDQENLNKDFFDKFYLKNMLEKSGLFVEKNTHVNGSPQPFLISPPIMNAEHSTKNTETVFEASLSEAAAIHPTSVEQNSKSEQQQMNFGQFMNERYQTMEEQKVIEKTLLIPQFSSEFVQHIKEQFEKFQNSQDKKVTFHLRDKGKNLTMIFDMKHDDSIHLLFRTTDSDWKNVLDKNRSALLEALGTDNINIRYLGE